MSKLLKIKNGVVFYTKGLQIGWRMSLKTRTGAQTNLRIRSKRNSIIISVLLWSKITKNEMNDGSGQIERHIKINNLLVIQYVRHKKELKFLL